MNGRKPARLTILGLIFTAGVALWGCGKSSSENSQDGDGLTQVIGNAAFGNQCPYGTYVDPKPSKLTGWACLGLKTIELSENPPPLLLQGDCKKKSLVIRSADGKVDTLWEVMPDGSFFITMDSGAMKLKTDGSGNIGCTIFPSMDIWGKLNCTDRDRMNIQVEAVFWPGKGKKLESNTSVSECRLPDGCYLYTSADIRQCQ